MSPEYRTDGVYGTLEERLEEDTAELLFREQLLGVSFRDRLRQRRRKPGGRPRGRVVSWEKIVDWYDLLKWETGKRPSQADIAERMNEPVDNIERTCRDYPGAWKGLTRR